MQSQSIKSFEFAIGHGFITENPAQNTLPIKPVVYRKRLTLVQLNITLSFMTLHIQPSMMLLLTALQRREDIIAMTFAGVKKGFLYISVKAEKSKGADRAYMTVHSLDGQRMKRSYCCNF